MDLLALKVLSECNWAQVSLTILAGGQLVFTDRHIFLN